MLFEILQELDANGKYLELIKNIYWQQQAAVRIGQGMSDWVNIARGVGQGCVLSPQQFLLYTDMIIRKINHMDRVRRGGINENNIRYADDTAIVADSEKLQNRISVIADESRKFGLQINKRKAFCMTVSRKNVSPKCNLEITINRNQVGREIRIFRELNDIRCKIRWRAKVKNLNHKNSM